MLCRLVWQPLPLENYELWKTRVSVVSTLHSTTVLAYLDVCAFLETTPGVFQASGYGDLTATESIWFVLCRILHPANHLYSLRFWFFAARNNPDTAPLALWFNGGVSNPLLGSHR